RHHSAHGLHAEGQGNNVEEKHVLHLAADYAGLHGSSHRHYLVGVYGHVGLLAAGELLHHILDRRDTGGSAHEDNFVDFLLGELRCRKSVLHGSHTAFHEGGRKLVELRTGNGHVEVL